jgi:O-antigen/teichoic acid export membrane protein
MRPAQSGPRRLIANAASLLTSDALNRATTFVLYALVGRHLGAHDFGRLSLALTLFYVFQVLAAAGLKSLVMREVARDRSEAARYLVNGSLVAVGSSLLALAGLFLFVRIMRYPSDAENAVLLLALGLMPFALSAVCEGVLQGIERTTLIATAYVLVNTLKIVLVVLFLSRGYGLLMLIGVLVGCLTCVVVLEWMLLLRSGLPWAEGRPDWDVCVALVRKTLPFVGIDGVVALGASLNILILAALGNERDVGLFSSVSQLMVPVTVVFSSVMLSISPLLFRRFASQPEEFRRIAERSVEVLTSIGVPSAIVLCVLADRLLLLLYGGDEFSAASDVMRLMSWNLIGISLTWAFGQIIVASMRERDVLRIVVIDAGAGLLIGLVLTSRFGLIGAGMTAVAMRLIDFVQHFWCVTALHPDLRIGPLVWKPFVAGVVMAGYLLLIRDASLFVVLPTASAMYGATLLVLAVWGSGGAHQFKGRYIDAWSD